PVSRGISSASRAQNTRFSGTELARRSMLAQEGIIDQATWHSSRLRSGWKRRREILVWRALRPENPRTAANFASSRYGRLRRQRQRVAHKVWLTVRGGTGRRVSSAGSISPSWFGAIARLADARAASAA